MRENLLLGGDYVPDGFGGFVGLTGEEALLQRALFKLTCRRGAFPFLPELGSRLWLLGREKPGSRETAATLYGAEALQGMGLVIRRTQVRMLGDGRAEVTYWMTREGETMRLEVTV